MIATKLCGPLKRLLQGCKETVLKSKVGSPNALAGVLAFGKLKLSLELNKSCYKISPELLHVAVSQQTENVCPV